MQTMNSQKTMSSTSSDANSQSKRIDLMFSRFAAFYGHIWRSQFKNEGFFEFAKKEWDEGLRQFSDEALHKAAINCRDFCEMPPTLPQVIGYCRQFQRRNDFYVANHVKAPRKLEVMTSQLKQCKDILNKQ